MAAFQQGMGVTSLVKLEVGDPCGSPSLRPVTDPLVAFSPSREQRSYNRLNYHQSDTRLPLNSRKDRTKKIVELPISYENRKFGKSKLSPRVKSNTCGISGDFTGIDILLFLKLCRFFACREPRSFG